MVKASLSSLGMDRVYKIMLNPSSPLRFVVQQGNDVRRIPKERLLEHLVMIFVDPSLLWESYDSVWIVFLSHYGPCRLFDMLSLPTIRGFRVRLSCFFLRHEWWNGWISARKSLVCRVHLIDLGFSWSIIQILYVGPHGQQETETLTTCSADPCIPCHAMLFHVSLFMPCAFSTHRFSLSRPPPCPLRAISNRPRTCSRLP